ncbi:hypothetical protein OEZ86_013407 [Tetradesmus obliquus]|nr:hypothetical protein OEZ86_013407 [Tetradesmus obliquus]
MSVGPMPSNQEGLVELITDRPPAAASSKPAAVTLESTPKPTVRAAAGPTAAAAAAANPLPILPPTGAPNCPYSPCSAIRCAAAHAAERTPALHVRVVTAGGTC